MASLAGVGGGIAAFVASGTQLDRVTTAETMFAYFVTARNLPLAIADDFSKMVGKMFPDSEIARKYSSGRTKMTQIVKGALAPQFEKVLVWLNCIGGKTYCATMCNVPGLLNSMSDRLHDFASL